MAALQMVYVVTRNGRRIEAQNYREKNAATERAAELRTMLKAWEDPDVGKVRIKRTDRPNQVR